MCGRYTITAKPEDIAAQFAVQQQLFTPVPRYNVAPSQTGAVITADHTLQGFRWGLIPSWAKDEKIGYKMINARAETVDTTNSFRAAFKARRCLIPSDGFYEWKKLDAKTKQPYHIRMQDRSLFAFAGLWEQWKNAEGEWLHTYTIITCPPNEVAAEIHDRMPAILTPEAEAIWLDPLTPKEDLLALLAPYSAKAMEAVQVGPEVGNVKNDRADLLNSL